MCSYLQLIILSVIDDIFVEKVFIQVVCVLCMSAFVMCLGIGVRALCL